MNRLFFPLVLCVFFTTSLGKADMTVLNKTPDTTVPPGILKQQNLQSIHNLHLALNTGSVQQVKGRVGKSGSIIALNTLIADNKSAYAGFLSTVSPDYRINRNFLSLAKVSANRRERSIMFVFLMNNPNKKQATEQTIDSSHANIHVLWPWSKKMKVEQMIIKDEYPIDFSIANYEDGYAPEEWNLVLPHKKPREVDVSLVWSF